MLDEQTFAAIWARITEFVARFAAWADMHVGLSSWLGALGPTLAVILVWALARAEYKRDRRTERIWANNEIDLIRQIVGEFEQLHSRYVDTMLSKDSNAAYEFSVKHANSATVQGFRDLSNLPISQWPSFESYVLFKDYFNKSIGTFEPSDRQGLINKLSTKQLSEHEINFNNLKAALEKAKR